jgi:hypothetical protein
MKAIINCIKCTFFFLLTSLLFASPLDAQRMAHGASGRSMGARPSGGMNAGRGSINGGSMRSPSRPSPSTRPSTMPSRNTGGANNRMNENNRANVSNKMNNGNRNNIGNNNNRGSNINIDRSTNIHINNSHNTVVRHGRYYGHYPRPPYAYGGFYYHSYHPYYYHPYTPFYWGPAYYPWGFFVATMATTAILVSVNNQQYYYDAGTYYLPEDNGYTVVQAPVGATVKSLPKETETVVVNETTNNYYYGGTYYEKSDDGYTVVPPTAGTVVEHLPEGAEEVKLGDVTYVKFGETYYQPIQQDGQNMYEVVEVEKAEE